MRVGLARLDFVCFYASWQQSQNIDFMFALVSVEKKLFFLALVASEFHDVVYDQILKQGASKRMSVHLFKSLDTQKERSQTCIVEIKLWHLGESFANVGIIRVEEINDIRSREYADPMANGVYRYACFDRQIGCVEFLPYPRRTKSNESLESLQILDIDGMSGNAIRQRVVLPDCRGPVNVMTGK